MGIISKLNNSLVALIIVVLSFSAVVTVYAANNTNLNQTINSGTLLTDIRDASRVPVASPAVAFSATTFSFNCLSGGARPTGTFGTNIQRIYVDNPGAANNGWTLTMAATGGATSLWNDGGSLDYDFNDVSGAPAGCADGGGDADAFAGQLSVDPTVGTINADCATCVITNISLGSASAFDQGTTDSITLLNAALASDNIGRWYLTGVDLDQTIPAEQPNTSYTINMTLTVTAI